MKCVTKTSLVYQRRNPEKTVLYQVLQERIETFLARGESEPGQMDWPCFVKRELCGFLECGIRVKGFWIVR